MTTAATGTTTGPTTGTTTGPTAGPSAGPAAGPTAASTAGPATVLGVDGCAGAWAVARWDRGSPHPPSLRLVPDPASVLALAELAGAAVVGLDLPLGLPARGRRAADVEARRALRGPGGSASRVFATPVRPLVAAATLGYPALREHARALGEPVPSAQAHALLAHVRAWDGPAADPVLGVAAGRLVEVHPEVSFREMTGRVLARKRSARGACERLAALAGPAGLGCGEHALVAAVAGADPGIALDDALDALAVAWTAARVADGTALRLPDPPEVDERGIPMAIQV